jgi:hypothetical protein
MKHAHMAPSIAELLGEPVKAHDFANGTHFRADNGNGFYLWAASHTTPEHIAHCLRGRA